MKIEIEYDLTGSVVPDYAMYTELGNTAVHAIVVAAKTNRLSWAETHDALCELAKQDAFGEATDTAVREMVYSALGVKDEPFYVW
jgi:leucyl aminopeptidase (aminopeptidase T)